MPTPQNYKNHVRFDPIWHFFIAPVLLLNLAAGIYVTIHHWPQHHALMLWGDFMAVILLLAVLRARMHTLVEQDRIIRLEERLRFQALLPPDLLARSHSLSVEQIVGLRFASDDELPGLVRRALEENLTRKQIKQAINNWRPDYLRA